MNAATRRNTRKLARRLTEAAAIVLALAGLLMFVLAPLFSGPRPWSAGKMVDTRPADATSKPSAIADRRAADGDAGR
jgi:hypothetical protein